MATDVENKLDEDFLFYLGFTTNFSNQLSKEEIERCRAWLQRLCGERCEGIDKKRNRNIYLSNLVLCMQNGNLTKPFESPPNEVDISNAMQVFGHVPIHVGPPKWLQDIENLEDTDEDSRDGRTYLATRTLPDGAGAFAYIAVTLADDEPRWLGAGEGMFERTVDDKYRESMPPMFDLEHNLLRRKDQTDREKVISFYDTLLQNIDKELEEISPEENEIINGLLEQLIKDLRSRGQYAQYEIMTAKQKRMELLLILHDRVYARREQILHRQDVMDGIQHKTLPPSFFDITAQDQDKIDLPGAMWEQAINKQPNKKNMEALFEKYPHALIEKFLELLANEKEEVAVRMQRRHENIVVQMRKELLHEGEKGYARVEEAERSFRQTLSVLAAVKTGYLKHLEQRKKMREKQVSSLTDNRRIYEHMQAAVDDSQRTLEDEAQRGRLMLEQINAISTQTDLYKQVNECNIRNMEAQNATLMRNIKRLRSAIRQQEGNVARVISSNVQQNKPTNQEFLIY